MASQNHPEPSGPELPFGAGAIEPLGEVAVDGPGRGARRGRRQPRGERERRPAGERSPHAEPERGGPPDASPSVREAPRGGPDRGRESVSEERHGRGDARERAEGEGAGQATAESGGGYRPLDGAPGERTDRRSNKWRRWQDRRRRRRRKDRPDNAPQPQGGSPQAPPLERPHPDRQPDRHQERAHPDRRPQERPVQERRPDGGRPGDGGSRGGLQPVEGLLVLDKGNFAQLRRKEKGYLPSKEDVHVSTRLVQKLQLREGSLIAGTMRRGHGRTKWDLETVTSVDGKDPREVQDAPRFKNLTSIDPDFHYAMGDSSGEVALRIVDLIAPIGRGQRGLIVAPPRSGKTILLQQMAKAIEKTYPEVHLMVLLVDERPEEATEWSRTLTTGEVFVSTNDEMPKRHVELAEIVWRRCRRLVELGEDVILLMDSITRLGRAYNNVLGTSGKTMSGGIDTRALERPKQFFGSARNTETAGSLTIIATTLIETGSRMDQIIFEEFKGTGNMELVLSRKLADRRIFPAIDIQKSGTRKEEKLISSNRLRLIQTLRRVLLRMHFAEAMELLISKLEDVERTDDFLNRFEVDPEA